jgi:uncharacterized protein YndB with AHSA1/START domain
MSIEFQVTEILPAPPERVFHAMTNAEEFGEWMQGFVRMERVGGPAKGAGARWRETRTMFGKETTEEFEVTHFHPPSHLALRVDGTKGTMGRGVFEFDYKLAQRVGGTEVRMTARVDGMLPPALRWMGRLLITPIRRACVRDLRALAEHLRHAIPAGTS